MFEILIMGFFAALFEAIPVFGFIVPGMTFLAFTGFLAAHGCALPLLLLFVGSLGAFFGDFISYLLERLYGVRWLLQHSKKAGLTREHITRLQDGVRHHAVKTLVLGCFNSLARSFTPFLAGASKVSELRFFFAAAVEGCLVVCGSFSSWLFCRYEL